MELLMPGRYRSYGREDDRLNEDLESGFIGFNNRLRPDQLQPGVLVESNNGRLDLNGEWQVRKGINVLNVPFAAGPESFRLPVASEFTSVNPSSKIGLLPRVLSGAVQLESNGTVTVNLTDHGFSVGDVIAITGVFKNNFPDINGTYTITQVTGNDRFKFDSGILGTSGYSTFPPDVGLVTPFTLSFDPVNELISSNKFAAIAGKSFMNEAAVIGVRAGTAYSDSNVDVQGDYIIVSTNLNALVLNLSTLESFTMSFPPGEPVLERADMLQAFNRLFIFRDGQVALENNKFFNPVSIKQISQSGTEEVTVETFQSHGLVDGDQAEIRDVGFAPAGNDPNGQFEVTSSTDTTLTYNLGASGTETYTTTVDSKVYPTFTLVANGDYTQPAQISTTITTVNGITTCVSTSDHNLTTGNTVVVEAQGSSNLVNGEEYVVTVVDSTTFTIFVPHPNEPNTPNVVFERPVSIGLGFMHMPMPEFGVYHQRRLVVPFRYNQSTSGLGTVITQTGIRDEIAASDILDSDTFDQVYATLRFNAGTADFTVGLHSFSDDKLLVFNRNSIHLVINSGDLRTVQTQLLTDEVGCVARDSIIQVGNNVLFLSDNGVYGANFQDLYNLRGNEVPLSEPINNTIKFINKDLWDKSSGVYFDNRYYLAVPLDEETVVVDEEGNVSAEINRARFNNRVIIYNFLNKQWESIDSVGESEFEFKKLIVAGEGNQRGVYIISTNGGIHKLDELDQGNDRVIVQVAAGDDPNDLIRVPEIEGAMTTRMFTNQTIDRKKWNNFEMHVQSHIDLKSDFFITGITENVDDTMDLKKLSDYLNNELLSEDEDVSIRGRIGNKRAYGFQFKIDRTTGRPRVRSLKVAAAEAFRSTREAI